MARLRFSIVGRPKAKGRPRAFGRVVATKDGPKAVVSLMTPKDTRATQNLIAWEFKRQFPGHRPFTGPVMLRFTAIFEIPTSFSELQKQHAREGKLYHTSKPDKDNIEKMISDALNGLAWVDDAQVQGGGIKRYGTAERIDIIIETLDHVGNPADKRRADKLAQPRLRLK